MPYNYWHEVKMTQQLQKYPKAKNGASKRSTGSTGNSAEGQARADKASTSVKPKSPADSTLPAWVFTKPEILASQLQETLSLMQKAGWFVHMELQVAENGRAGISLLVSPPQPHKIGELAGTIYIDDVPVIGRVA